MKWVPDSKSVVLKEVYYRCDAPFRQVSLVLFFEKITKEFD